MEYLHHTGLAELENINKHMTGVAHQNDCERLVELDLTFHQRMVTLAGNDIFISAWIIVAAQSFRSLVITNFEYSDTDAIYSVHRIYLEKIRSGDFRRAREMIE